MIAVACMQGQPLHGRRVCVCEWRDCSALDTFMPFPFLFAHIWLAQVSKADSWLFWGYEVNKVKHILPASTIEGQVQHEWIKAVQWTCRSLNWKGKCCVGVYMCAWVLHFWWDGPTQWLSWRLQALLSRNNRLGHQCYLGLVLFKGLCKESIIFFT